MFKRFKIIIAAFLVFITAAVPLSASAEGISVFINGSELSFSAEPYMKNDRVMVPMRIIFESLGASVEWDGDNQRITASGNGNVVILAIGVNTMYADLREVYLDVAPELIGDTTFVPLRAVSEALGCTVSWSDFENRVYIEYNMSAQSADYYSGYEGVPDFGKRFGLSPVSVIDGSIYIYDLNGLEPKADEIYADIMKSEGFTCARSRDFYTFVRGDITVLAGKASGLYRVVLSK